MDVAPKDGTAVLASCFGEVFIAYLTRGSWWRDDGSAAGACEPVGWMPLPEPIDGTDIWTPIAVEVINRAADAMVERVKRAVHNG